jgi:hypothetical protein
VVVLTVGGSLPAHRQWSCCRLPCHRRSGRQHVKNQSWRVEEVKDSSFGMYACSALCRKITKIHKIQDGVHRIYAYIIYLCYNTMPILCNTFMMTGPRLLLLLLLSLLCLSDQAITSSDCKVDSECFNGGTCVKGNASAPSGIQLYVSSLFCFSSLVSSIALHRAFQSYNKKISPVHIKELCLHGSLEWNELPNPLCAVS